MLAHTAVCAALPIAVARRRAGTIALVARVAMPTSMTGAFAVRLVARAVTGTRRFAGTLFVVAIGASISIHIKLVPNNIGREDRTTHGALHKH